MIPGEHPDMSMPDTDGTTIAYVLKVATQSALKSVLSMIEARIGDHEPVTHLYLILVVGESPIAIDTDWISRVESRRRVKIVDVVNASNLDDAGEKIGEIAAGTFVSNLDA